MHYWLKVVLTIYKNCPPYLCYSNKNVNSVGLSWFLTQYVKQPENSKICFGWLAQSNAKKVWWKIIGLKFICELVACLTLNFTTVIMLAHTVSFYKKIEP